MTKFTLPFNRCIRDCGAGWGMKPLHAVASTFTKRPGTPHAFVVVLIVLRGWASRRREVRPTRKGRHGLGRGRATG
jgi:hypothetical protein